MLQTLFNLTDFNLSILLEQGEKLIVLNFNKNSNKLELNLFQLFPKIYIQGSHKNLPRYMYT